MVIETKDEVVHPEGMILLLNGNLLQCEKMAKKEQPDSKAECKDHNRDVQLFEKYAFELFQRKDVIFSDSRMFLCPVDTGSGIAYSGRSGFTGATLGVWLEWWESCQNYRMDDKGRERLITFISGSPLSGTNSCSALTPSGERLSVSFSPFYPVWSSFVRINSRYQKVASQYESYSLDEVISKLHISTNEKIRE